MTKALDTEEAVKYNQLLDQKIGLERSIASAKKRLHEAEEYLANLQADLEKANNDISELAANAHSQYIQLSWRDVFDCDKVAKRVTSVEIMNMGYQFYVENSILYHAKTCRPIGDSWMVV